MLDINNSDTPSSKRAITRQQINKEEKKIVGECVSVAHNDKTSGV
jgi:hypothetical protein